MFHAFSNRISPKVNIIARLELGRVYFEAVFQPFPCYQYFYFGRNEGF